MKDYAKIVSNLKKLADAGLPDSEIDDYAKHEGVTFNEIAQYQADKARLDAQESKEPIFGGSRNETLNKKSSVTDIMKPESLATLPGMAEGLVRGAGSFIGSLGGAVGGMVSAPFRGKSFTEGATEGMHAGGEFGGNLGVLPKRITGEAQKTEEILGHIMEAAPANIAGGLNKKGKAELDLMRKLGLINDKQKDSMSLHEDDLENATRTVLEYGMMVGPIPALRAPKTKASINDLSPIISRRGITESLNTAQKNATRENSAFNKKLQDEIDAVRKEMDANLEKAVAELDKRIPAVDAEPIPFDPNAPLTGDAAVRRSSKKKEEPAPAFVDENYGQLVRDENGNWVDRRQEPYELPRSEEPPMDAPAPSEIRGFPADPRLAEQIKAELEGVEGRRPTPETPPIEPARGPNLAPAVEDLTRRVDTLEPAVREAETQRRLTEEGVPFQDVYEPNVIRRNREEPVTQDPNAVPFTKEPVPAAEPFQPRESLYSTGREVPVERGATLEPYTPDVFRSNRPDDLLRRQQEDAPGIRNAPGEMTVLARDPVYQREVNGPVVERAREIASRGGSIQDLLSSMGKNPKLSIWERALAGYLRSVLKDPVPLLYDAKYPSAAYSAMEHAVKFGDRLTTAHKSFLHEAVHAATTQVLYMYSNKYPVKAMKKLYEYFKDNEISLLMDTGFSAHYGIDNRGHQRGMGIYGLKDVHEFVAEGLSNKEFQEFLKNTTLPQELAKSLEAMKNTSGEITRWRGSKNLWSIFTGYIADMLGMSKKDASALPIFLDISKDLTQLTAFLDDNYGGNSGIGFRKQFMQDWWSDVTKKPYEPQWEGTYGKDSPVSPITQQMLDKARKQQTRQEPKANIGPDGDLVIKPPTKGDAPVSDLPSPKEAFEKWKDVPDIPPQTEFWRIGKLLNTQFLAEANLRNPLVVWLDQYTNNIIKANRYAADLAKEGVTFVKAVGTNLMRKVIDPNSPKGLNEALSAADRNLAADIQLKLQGKKFTEADILREGGSEAIAKYIMTGQARLNEGIRGVNALLQQLGREPVALREGYWPVDRTGDYMVTVKDASGNTIEKRGVNYGWQGNKLKKELEVKFANEGYTITVEATPNKGTNPHNTATVLLDNVLKGLDKADPRRKAVSEAIADFQKRNVFRGHGKKRRDIAGGEITGQSMHKVFESYIDSLYNYKAALEMEMAKKELLGIEGSNQPNFQKYAVEQFEYAQGRETQQYVPKFDQGVDSLASILGLGSSFPRKAMNAMNSWFYYSKLFGWKISTLAAQVFQSSAFRKQWGAHYQQMGLNGNIFNAEVFTMKALWNKEPEFLSIVEEQYKRGNIDPQLIHQMGLLSGEGKFQPFKSENAQRAVRMIAGETPMRAVESYGRLMSTAFAYQFLKDAGLSGKELTRNVEIMTEQIMGKYDPIGKPGIVGRSGLIGGAISPLSTFMGNFWGLTYLMLKDIKNKPLSPSAYKGMALHLYQTALYGGLTGMVGFAEIDLIIKAMRLLGAYPEDMKTPVEWALSASETGIPDPARSVLQYGVISGATTMLDARGAHIGAGMASPEIRSPMGLGSIAPGVGVTFDTVKSMMQTMADIIGARDMSKAEKQSAIQNIFGGIYAKLAAETNLADIDWQNPMAITDLRMKESGDTIPDAKRGDGKVRVQDNWDRAARLTGSGTLEDVRARDIKYDRKGTEEAESAKVVRLVDLATDAVMLGKDPMPYIDEAVEKFRIPPNDIMKRILEQAKKRDMTEAEIFTKGKGRRSQERGAYMENAR